LKRIEQKRIVKHVKISERAAASPFRAFSASSGFTAFCKSRFFAASASFVGSRSKVTGLFRFTLLASVCHRSTKPARGDLSSSGFGMPARAAGTLHHLVSLYLSLVL